VPGEHSAHLTIHSNDSAEPLKRVYLTVRIAAKDAVPRLEIEPLAIDLGLVSDQAPVERRIRVQNRGELPLGFEEFTSSPSVSIVSRPPAELPPGAQGTLTLKLKVGETGIVRAHLALVTNDPKRPVVTVPIQGYVASAQEIADVTRGVLITADRDRGETGNLRSLQVANHGSSQVAVSQPSQAGSKSVLLDPGMSVKLKVEQPHSGPDAVSRIEIALPLRTTQETAPAERK